MTKKQPVLPKEPKLKDLQEYVRLMAEYRGFDRDSVQDRFILLTEEVGELAKAVRSYSGVKLADGAKQTELEDELADVLIVLLGVSNLLQVDLEKALRAKEEKNKKRTWS